MPAASIVAHGLHGWTGVVGAVARHVDHAAQAFIAALVKQRHGEAQGTRNRRSRRTTIGRTRDLGRDRVGGFRSVDQPPRPDDFLVELTGPLKICDGDLAVRAWRSACRNSFEVNARM